MKPGVDHFEAAVAQRARDYFCASIVAIESGLRNQNSESLVSHR
jgi:hypothetical protein